MEAEFVEIVRRLVSKRGKDDLFDVKLCRAALADLTKNKYKRERNLLLQAVESGAAKAIDDASGSDLQICKQRQIRKLEEDYNCKQSAAEEVVNMLALILCGDSTTTVIPQSPKPVQMPPAASSPSVICESVDEVSEEKGNRKKRIFNILIIIMIVVVTSIIYLIGPIILEATLGEKITSSLVVSFYVIFGLVFVISLGFYIKASGGRIFIYLLSIILLAAGLFSYFVPLFPYSTKILSCCGFLGLSFLGAEFWDWD